VLSWFLPGSAAFELIGARIDGAEIGLWRLRPVRILLANSDRLLHYDVKMRSPDPLLPKQIRAFIEPC
jgi:hypothetical protein